MAWSYSLQRAVWAGEGEGLEPPWSLKAESIEEREAGYRGPVLRFSSPGFCALPSPWLEWNCSPLLRFLHLFIQRALFLWAVASAVLPGVTGSLEAGQRGDENSPNRWPWVST